MVFDAFKELGIEAPEGMELYFSGSLAKAQATEYSDLDAMVILKNQEDVERVRPVFDALNYLFIRIFDARSQLFPDPIGMNPAKLIGTPDVLFNKLKNDEFPATEFVATAMIASKPILGHFELGKQLQQKIRNEKKFENRLSPKGLYNLAIKDHRPPAPTAEHVNLKEHIMRPLDFILMGLREELGLDSEDGSHLSALGTIKLLRLHKSISEDYINCIEIVYNNAMKKRFDLHANKGKESDDIPYAEAQSMLDEIAKLRDMAKNRINALNTVTVSNVEQDKIPKGFFARNAGAFKFIGLAAASLVVGAAVGLGLAFSGVLTIPLAVAAGAATLGLAAIGYGIFKFGQAISRWRTAGKNTAIEPQADNAHDNIRQSTAGMLDSLTAIPKSTVMPDELSGALQDSGNAKDNKKTTHAVTVAEPLLEPTEETDFQATSGKHQP